MRRSNCLQSGESLTRLRLNQPGKPTYKQRKEKLSGAFEMRPGATPAPASPHLSVSASDYGGKWRKQEWLCEEENAVSSWGSTYISSGVLYTLPAQEGWEGSHSRAPPSRRYSRLEHPSPGCFSGLEAMNVRQGYNSPACPFASEQDRPSGQFTPEHPVGSG